MIKLKNSSNEVFMIQLMTKKSNNSKVIAKNLVITEFVNENKAFIYYDKPLNKEALVQIAQHIVNAHRVFKVDVPSFVSEKTKEADVIFSFYEADIAKYGKTYWAKSKAKPSKETFLINLSKDAEKIVEKAKTLTEAKEIAMNFQMMPPNLLNSETYAQQVQELFKNDSNLKIKVLDKKTITDLKMGLLLSVNKGSAFDPRVVIIEYQGNPQSKEKTAFVGKGITFDAGGYNIKTGGHMRNMKFDMSGSAAVVGALKAISVLKPKTNVVGILVLTDNMISSLASTPDSVWTAMNGKTVEVNNTDAEGRLAMADGMVYAAQKLDATRIVTIATLTGAVIVALGGTYTGTWATTDKAWSDVEKAAKTSYELVWRMPLHPDFFKFMQSSKIADMFNTDLSGKGGGSSTAAMFLSQFAENREFIHFDIAGTADQNGEAKGAMVKTLFELVNNG